LAGFNSILAAERRFSPHGEFLSLWPFSPNAAENVIAARLEMNWHPWKRKLRLHWSDFGCGGGAIFSLVMVTWGRCYDHNFLRFATIFGAKIGVFSKKTTMFWSKFLII
jgi:hypothetical protein